MINAFLFLLQQQDLGKGCLKKEKVYTHLQHAFWKMLSFRQLFAASFHQKMQQSLMAPGFA